MIAAELDPSPTPAPPAHARAGTRLAAWGWDRVRWLAAELTIVVAGILIALAIQSRVDAAADRASEHEYLLQLQADLRETERVVMRDDSIHRVRDRAGVNLLHAFFTPERPPRDSVLVWALNATWYETPRAVLGTTEALVATGHLRLLRDPALRSAVTAYLEENRTLTAEQLAVEEDWVRASEEVRHALDYSQGLELLPQTREDSLAVADPLFYFPRGDRRQPFRVDLNAFLTDQQAYHGVADMYWGKYNMEQLRATMLRSARTLRARVDAALRAG